MVWHTFMLNPRDFLEDCIRYGKLNLWKTGLPWEAIDACIDNDSFEFSASEKARQRFVNNMDLAWDSLYDSSYVEIQCPECRKHVSCPWTTCDSKSQWIDKPGELGTGFADRNFEARCKACGFSTDHEILRATKYSLDVERLRSHDNPMPGTLLDKNGEFQATVSIDNLTLSRAIRQGANMESTPSSTSFPKPSHQKGSNAVRLTSGPRSGKT